MNLLRPSTLRVVALVVLILLVLAACGRNTPTPSPTPVSVVVPPFSGEESPPDEATAEVEKATGGTISLQDGAQVTLPPESLVADATVSFRTADNPPVAPVPSSILGRAYELMIDGSELAGIAQVRLPLLAGVTPDQYEMAPYRWTGRLWERVTARDVTGGIQFGVNSPGVYALLGRWRLADASLALVKPDTAPGQQVIPLTVVGQYRYSAIPALQDGLVPARLVLKQDSSGGAGLVAGDPGLDQTVDQATLYFKPDPANSQGLIEFSHVFELVPGALDLDPGVNTRFYAVLMVEDAAAPTRRISSGVEYTQNLPIEIKNMEVVRPIIVQEDRVRLRWKISLNGLTFQTPEARSPTLALQPIVDEGGVGDYKIVLEVENEGAWVPISNELSIQLAVRTSPTPTGGATTQATPAVVAITTPGAIPTPAVPTRRPTPVGGGNLARVTATRTITPTASATPTPTPRPGDPLWADKEALVAGECTSLHWKVENVISVQFNGQGVTGEETREVCPATTTNYVLRVTSSAGTQEYIQTIQVAAAGEPAIAFTADKTTVAPGECATLSWSATDVKSVHLNGQGVAGVATQQVCPANTANFELVVVTNAGQTITKTIPINVRSSAPAFWADRYALDPGACTTLHWSVQNVQSVYLDGEGVAGEGQKTDACPTVESQFYTLDVNTADGSNQQLQVELTTTGTVGLLVNEIIAQGTVKEIVPGTADVNPIEPGDQPGYHVVMDGVRVLYSGTPGYSEGTVTLGVRQAFIDQANTGQGLHWPVRPGQPVEFRATCDGPTCWFDFASEPYLYWRGQ